MNQEQELIILRQKVSQLQEKIEHLRFSRRILMNLVERLEREKSLFVNQLERENKKLQQHNSKFAQCLLAKNRVIMNLERQLSTVLSTGRENCE
ncbi:MAG: translation initiation factor 2 [Clostridia bacterium]|nr:translation initiation factor 2 [Clostridia bacterium]